MEKIYNLEHYVMPEDMDIIEKYLKWSASTIGVTIEYAKNIFIESVTHNFTRDTEQIIEAVQEMVVVACEVCDDD